MNEKHVHMCVYVLASLFYKNRLNNEIKDEANTRKMSFSYLERWKLYYILGLLLIVVYTDNSKNTLFVI